MKIAFISDVHGNAVALESVLKDIEKRNVDKVYVLGDICFRGPEPKRSLELIRALDADVIKGNADEWVVRGIKQGEVPDAALATMQEEQKWTASKLSREELEYLADLPTELQLEYGKVKIHAFHATPNSLFEAIQPFAKDDVLNEKLMINDTDVYIYGHIHKSYIRYLNGKCVINTGSVGLPFDGFPYSSYALIDIQDENVQASIIRTKYNVTTVLEQFSNSNYPNKDLMMDIVKNGKI